MKRKTLFGLAISLILLSLLCISPALAAEAPEPPECYVTLDGVWGETAEGDREYYLTVPAYGEPFTLPECMFTCEDESFLFWEYEYEIYYPGDTLVAEMCMEIEACWISEDSFGTILFDSVSQTTSKMTTSESVTTLEHPYDDSSVFNSVDAWFVGWNTKADGSGTSYAAHQEVTLEAGKPLILYAIWNTDITQAWKVSLDFNQENDEDFFDNDYYRYVKKGEDCKISCFMGIGGYAFDGWYDSAEGGKLLCADEDYFTPTADITLYAHWLPKKLINVTEESTQHGEVYVEEDALPGDELGITIMVEDGYLVDAVTMKDAAGQTVELTPEDGYYTFVMPDADVTVSVSYVTDTRMAQYFTDVEAGDYFYGSVLWAAEKGIVNGTGNKLFAPNSSVTRGQFVTMLWRASGSPEPENTESVFADVPETSYCYKAVLWAVEEGITNGTSATEFSPDLSINREQLATFLYRHWGETMEDKSIFWSDYTDRGTVSSWAVEAMNWCVDYWIIRGVTEDTLAPASLANRAQAIETLYRYASWFDL